MKLSTARRLVCMSYFTVDGLRPLLATATRIVCSGDTKRFLFPDGSVIESNKGNWKVVGMQKNPKLEAAMRRFGSGQKLPDPIFQEGAEVGRKAVEKLLKNAEYGHTVNPEVAQKIDAALVYRMGREIEALQELLNQKDELASRPMVVRLDWWAVALVATVLVAHYGMGWL